MPTEGYFERVEELIEMENEKKSRGDLIEEMSEQEGIAWQDKLSLLVTGKLAPRETLRGRGPKVKIKENWEDERNIVNTTFSNMLSLVTGDGSKKRQKGEKPPWWRDNSHEAAIFSHLNRWKHGEKKDPDSYAHPLIHAAWRMLAIAYQETYGQVNPIDLPTEISTVL
jgi:hypothetical protein